MHLASCKMTSSATHCKMLQLLVNNRIRVLLSFSRYLASNPTQQMWPDPRKKTNSGEGPAQSKPWGLKPSVGRYSPLTGKEKELFDRLAAQNSTYVAHVMNEIVVRKRSSQLARTLSTYISNRQREEKQKACHQQKDAAPLQVPRHELLRKEGVNLKDMDWKKMPVVMNGHNVPAFLAADAEFVTDMSDAKNPELLVIMFSAVKIPLNGGTPVPVIHTLINHELDGKEFVSKAFEEDYIHGISRKDWKWHISTSIFVKALTIFMEKSYFCFWDATQDTIALRNTFRRAGKEADFNRLQHRIVDLQKPLQEIVRQPLRELDKGKRKHDRSISLENAVRALHDMQTELSLSAEKVAFIEKIIDAMQKSKGEERDPKAKTIFQRIRRGTAKKSSIVDANALAVLYNYLHARLNEDIESLAAKYKK